MYDLTAFQRDQLYVIAGLDGARGVTIQEELDEYYSQEVKSGRLYPNLDELAELGFVVKEPINRRSNAYKPTDRCYRVIAARRDWESKYVEQAEAGVGSEPVVSAARSDD